MNKDLKKLIEEQQNICHCSGPTCSGCEATTKKLLLIGYEFGISKRCQCEQCYQHDLAIQQNDSTRLVP